MLILFTSVLFICFLLFYNYFAYTFNIMDVPNERKIHNKPTPLIGGLCIFSTFYLSVYFFLELSLEMYIIMLGSFFILVIGFIDDFKTIKPFFRFSTQFVIVCLVVWLGIYIVDIGKYSFLPINHLGYVGILLTLFSVLCLINAINFIDGMDGLSISLIIIILSNIYLNIQNEASTNEKNFIIILIILSFLFLFFNFSNFINFKMFLGDAGSTTFGFIIAFLLVYFTMPEKRYFDPVLCIWVVTLPMFDLLNVIIKRIFNKIKVYYPDRNHIHHIFLKRGMKSNKILMILIFLSLFLNITGHLIFFNFGNDFTIISFVLFFIMYQFTLRKLQKI